jgi:ABC-type branched-subunit amino acid transport system substrate-binding protein
MERGVMRFAASIAVAFISVAAGLGARAAEPGVTPQKIVVGASVPLTGVLASYGTELEKGLKLGIAQANAAGGFGGREIELLVKDDAGKPDRAVANTKALIEAGVFALTGYHGPAAIEAALPLVEQSGTPLIGVAGSAELLREPARRGVFNLRAGARDEAAAMVLHLDTIGITDIAAIAQDDGLGTAALDGLQLELTRLAIRPQALVRVAAEAPAADVARSVQAACKGQPQALVLGLNAANALAVIRQARKSGCTPQFYVMSEAGAELLAMAAAPKELAGLIVSQVVPHPRSSTLPVTADYQRLAGDSASYAGLEGFIYARVIAAALKACAGQLHRNCVIAALEAKPTDVGGYRVQFKPGDRRGSRFVEMTIVTADGRFRR